MKLYSNVVLITFVGLLLGSCQTKIRREPIASDDDLSRRIVGVWVRDESYTYGRFIGTLVMTTGGSGSRKFDLISRTQSPGSAMVLDPLLFEAFRWHVEDGYIVFTDRRITDLDVHSPKWNKTENGKQHREYIASLNDTGMETIDPREKTDTYKKVSASVEPNHVAKPSSPRSGGLP